MRLYEKKGKCLKDDVEYLVDTYSKTEKFWRENFKKCTSVKIIILGEAPLFGCKESYIYNPETKPTPFLNCKNIEKICCGVKESEIPLISKDEMLAEMLNLGIVVLNLFPFAF